MFKGRYARFMFAPDTGADGGAGVGTNGADESGVEVDKTDYKALYEKEVARSTNLKKNVDSLSSELAEKKRTEKAKMSEEEKLQAEREEEKQRYIEMQNRVYEMETTTLFAEQGFDKKDYGELVKQIVSVSGEHATELSNSIIAFVKKSNSSAVANAKNSMLKGSAVTPKASTATTEEHRYASMAMEATKNDIDKEKIKNRYR